MTKIYIEITTDWVQVIRIYNVHITQYFHIFHFH